MQTTPPTASSTTPPETAPSSLTARLLNVYAAPAEAFDEIRARPPATGNWLVPTLLLCVLGIVFCFVVFSQPNIVQQVKEQQRAAVQAKVDAGELPASQAEQFERMMENFGPTMMKVGGSLNVVFFSWVFLFLIALFLMLVSRWAFHVQLPYMKFVELVGLATMISCLAMIVQMLLVIALGSLTASVGPALLIPRLDLQNKAHQAIASINLLTLWYVAILALGWSRFLERSFAKTAAWLFGAWALLRAVIITTGLGKMGM